MRKATICIFSFIFLSLGILVAQDGHSDNNHSHGTEASHEHHDGDGHDHKEDHSHDAHDGKHDHGAESHNHDDHDHGHDHHGDAHGDNHGDHGHHHHCECGSAHHEYNAGEVAFHHIMDANQFHLFGDYYVPLPCMLKSDDGFKFMLSSSFGNSGHGNGAYAVDRYVMVHGTVMRITDPNFPMGKVEVGCYGHEEKEKDGKVLPHYTVEYKGKCLELHEKSTLDGGVLGGGITSFYDFSITKNVFSMLLAFVIMFFMFTRAAKGYVTRKGMAPKGIQSLLEVVITFIRDEVAVPFLGHKADKFLPYLLSVFFFILGLNLLGQIPFFPGSGNVTGSLSVTAVLAIFTFILTTINGNKHYWEHIVWMPGVPAWVKIILTPVEIMGMFIKPLTLMLRLFANITAGHIVLIIFVSLIFIFGGAPTATEAGTTGGSILGTVMAVPLTMFMMAIELLVAFIQAFVFCILSAAYFSAAVEEAHH